MQHPVSPKAGPSPSAGMDRRLLPSRFGRLRRWRWPALALLIVAGGFAVEAIIPSPDTLTISGGTLTLATATKASFLDYLPVRATAAPLTTVFVDAVEGGTVDSSSVMDGASLRAGETLATLTNPQLQLDVTSREAAIAAQLGTISAQRLTLQQSLLEAQNGIAEASYNLLKAEHDLNIRQRLHDEGFESLAGLRTYEDEVHYYNSRVVLLRQAQSRDAPVAARQAGQIDETTRNLQRNLRVVQASLQNLVLRSPVAGRLTNFNLQPGQSLRQGDQIGQIDSENSYRLDADIDEFYLPRVRPGEKATADVEGVTETLHVARVKPQVSNGQFRTELVFDGASPKGLRRGESVDTRITLGDTTKVLVLPNDPWLEGSSGSFVYVISNDGRYAERKNIVSGRRTPEQVEIMSGLAPGDRVITSSYTSFAKFTKLIIR